MRISRSRIAFLDKEMQEVAKEGLKGAKFVDKLVKIYLKDGTEQWLLVHIEVQGEADRDFSLRIAISTESLSGTANR